MASAAEPVLYLDTSALVKLVVDEPESEALREAITGGAIVSSELALAELPRALRTLSSGRRRREREGVQEGMAAVLGAVAFVPLDRELLVVAGAFREAFLRTLDAIHIASALAVSEEVAAFVTYDERQAEVAYHAGFAVLAPA